MNKEKRYMRVSKSAQRTFLVLLLVFWWANPVSAHAPFLETEDFSAESPFEIAGSIEKSLAIYAYLEHASDSDVYSFVTEGSERIYVSVLVPLCAEYEQFTPTFTLVGPGLESSGAQPPFAVPEGYGAVTVEQADAAKDRETFYEPFSVKTYYRGPRYTMDNGEPGTWYIVYWDRAGRTGDYVAVVGFLEAFSLADILRTFYILPILWFDGELHVDCR